jgi:hypothetical protein
MRLINSPNDIEQLENESDKHFIFFCQFVNFGYTRTLRDFGAACKIPERTLYAYAKKFNWLERAMVVDQNRRTNIKNEELLIREKNKIEKLQILNRAQELANDIMCSFNAKIYSANMHSTKLETSPNDDENVYDKKQVRSLRLLKLIETYIKICTGIEKHIDQIINDYENHNDLDHNNLELEEYYKTELKLLETLAKEQPDISIIEEAQLIREYRTRQTKLEIA